MLADRGRYCAIACEDKQCEKCPDRMPEVPYYLRQFWQAWLTACSQWRFTGGMQSVVYALDYNAVLSIFEAYGVSVCPAHPRYIRAMEDCALDKWRSQMVVK